MIRAYCRAERGRGIHPTTIKSRRLAIMCFAEWLDGQDRTLDQATPADVDAFLATLDVSDRTYNNYLSRLRGFYDYMLREGAVELNPARRAHRRRTRRLLPRPIRDDHLDTALDAADDRMRLWLSLGAFAGLRCQEIAWLDRDDIQDWQDPPAIFVPARIAKFGNERFVPLHPRIDEALRRYDGPRSGHLFPGPWTAQPLKPGSVSAAIRLHFIRLGYDDTAHQLRHWFGTNLYRATRNLRLVAELMGHASMSTTAVYVALVREDDDIDAVTSLQPRVEISEPAPASRVSEPVARWLAAHLAGWHPAAPLGPIDDLPPAPHRDHRGDEPPRLGELPA